MKRIGVLVSFLVGSVILAAACTRAVMPSPSIQGTKVESAKGAYSNITVSQLKEMFINKDFLLVNVHIPYDGEIEGTDLFIPYNEIEQNLSRLPGNKGAKIVLYCRSGRMSTEAAQSMVDLGFTNIWNVTGGMIEWEKEGNTLIRK